MSDLALASRSPRRIELLRQIGVHPRVIDVVVDETPVVGEPAAALAMRLACAKALAGRGALGDEPVPDRPLPYRGDETAIPDQGS